MVEKTLISKKKVFSPISSLFLDILMEICCKIPVLWFWCILKLFLLNYDVVWKSLAGITLINYCFILQTSILCKLVVVVRIIQHRPNVTLLLLSMNMHLPGVTKLRTILGTQNMLFILTHQWYLSKAIIYHTTDGNRSGRDSSTGRSSRLKNRSSFPFWQLKDI